MNKHFKQLITASLFLASTFIFGQGQTWRWNFGNNAALNFPGGGAPVATAGSAMTTFEGCASIGTPAGALAFYTDGMKVWGANNIQMPNGFGLLGNSSTTQAAIIVPRPGNPNLYYIFCSSSNFSPGTLSYSEVDMTLNGGFGNINATKNVIICNNIAEKLTAVRHCNGVDVWVIVHDYTNSDYKAFLVTAAGVNAVPVISSAGAACAGNVVGVIKTSPDGKRIAYVASNGPFALHVADFNNSTGVVSNAINLAGAGALVPMYGLEFSPDSKLLYGSLWGPNHFQWNLCAGSPNAVISSSLLIGSNTGNTQGQMQLGPNGKIYVARAGASFLGVINNPNVLGMGCGYVVNGVSCAPGTSQYGLPTFIQSYLKLPPPPFTAAINCLTGTFTSPTATQVIQGCTTSTNNAINSYLWNFGDPSSGAANTSTVANPVHNFSGPGTYTVKLVLQYNCTSDTITGTVIAISCNPMVTITGKTFCQGGCAVITATAVGGTGPYTYSWTPNLGAGAGPFTVCPSSTTVYSVTITDAANVKASDTAVVVVNPSVSVNTTVKNIPCFGQANGTATANISGGTGPFNYTWTNGQNTAVSSSLTPGGYTVSVIDSKGCSAVASASITEPPLLTGTTSSQNILCNGALTGSASVAASGGTTPYGFSWTNNQSTPSITGIGAGNYTVTVLDANGCKLVLPVVITQPNALALSIITSTSNACAGTPINGNGNVLGGVSPYSYTWSPGPNTSSAVFSETVAGNYNYVLNVTDANGCVISSNVNLTFNQIPVASATSGTICYGDKGVLVASGAETYKWSPVNYSGSTFTTTGTSNMILTVVGTNTSTGCSSFPATATLIVNPLPVPEITASMNKGCVPLCMTFTSSNSGGNITNCSWDFGDGAFASNVINTDRCFTVAGDYTVRATVTDDNGCASSVTYSVNAYPIPTADFNFSPLKPIENDDVIFTDATHEATIAKWDWYFMNLPKPHSNLQNPVYMYSEAGTYAVALLVTSKHGCVDTIVKTIVVGEDYGIYVPNIFSPNGDGLNDVFQPKGFGISKYELRIFNRWGEELMMTNDFGHGWDGMYKGKLSKEDTYVWKINVTNVFGKSHELTGNVTLIK